MPVLFIIYIQTRNNCSDTRAHVGHTRGQCNAVWCVVIVLKERNDRKQVRNPVARRNCSDTGAHMGRTRGQCNALWCVVIVLKERNDRKQVRNPVADRDGQTAPGWTLPFKPCHVPPKPGHALMGLLRNDSPFDLSLVERGCHEYRTCCDILKRWGRGIAKALSYGILPTRASTVHDCVCTAF